ncbi:MAG: aspartate racemase [Brevundimonas sp.]|nr:aspartate racemase [Brevundimonas sp.]
MSRILGVLGGMGPAATVGFLAQIQALTPAQGDADHIRVLMDMNPQVPDRNRTPDQAEAVLAEMAARLKAAGAEILAMPCNTAHAQAAGIRAAGLPFIDMIAETTAAVVASGANSVGILATPGGEALYVAAFQAAGVTPVLLEGPDREAFMARIYGVKAGEVGEAGRARMKELAAGLVARGAEGIVAGCTEVPLLLAQGDVSVPLTDSAEVLARVCVARCA